MPCGPPGSECRCEIQRSTKPSRTPGKPGATPCVVPGSGPADHDLRLARQVAPAFRAAGRVRDIQIGIDMLRGLRESHPVAAHVAADLRRKLPTRVRKFASALEELSVTECKQSLRRLTPGKEQHRLRLQVKRLRYMQDWIASLPGSASMAAARSELKRLQDRLGKVSDSRTLRHAIERWDPPDAGSAGAKAHLLRSLTPRRARTPKGLK